MQKLAVIGIWLTAAFFLAFAADMFWIAASPLQQVAMVAFSGVIVVMAITFTRMEMKL